MPLLLLLVLSATTPTCAAKLTYQPQPYLLGRVVTLTPAADCPKTGRAYVRFRSRFGGQPDTPPGFFTLRPGQKLTRRVPWNWWVEARDKTLRWNRIPGREEGQ